MESIRIFHQWFCEWEFAEFPFKKPIMFFGKSFLWYLPRPTQREGRAGNKKALTQEQAKTMHAK